MNTINKYTSGPWKVIKPQHGHPSDYRCVQMGSDERYTTLEMLPADARLVAASPDMADALRVAGETIRWLTESNYDATPRRVIETTATIDAALVKAGAK